MSSSTSEAAQDICQSCGACCITYRVSFYWAEASALGIPDTLAEALTPWHACMRGTNATKPRCVALSGEVGVRVRCDIYAQRPSPCREVEVGDARCRHARACHGLAQLPEGTPQRGA